MLKKGSGILLHITSLPSKFGIGDLGSEAYRFVDTLAQAQQHYWQILPVNPTELIFGNSPYSSISAFAFNELLISPQLMKEAGWLTPQDLKSPFSSGSNRIDFEKVRRYKSQLFEKAFARFHEKNPKPDDYQSFCQHNESWLNDFALFVCLKANIPGESWNQWPADIRDRNPSAIKELEAKYSLALEKVKFLQYIFDQQWRALKDYCREKNVKLVGDMPIYVSYDSVDVWTHPEVFKLDDNRLPTHVAGVPPDYFSETGQRWGNPVYQWDRLKETGFAWWIDRMTHNLKLFDLVRIDHFRGIVAYWEIPAQEPTAVNGYWVNVPVNEFLTTLCEQFPEKPIIAEDLGIITPDVVDVMKRFEFPGMKVLLFAFNGDMQTHPYLPHNYDPNYVVYTGTHDNNTTRGWLETDATPQEKENLSGYLNKEITSKNICWELIELAMKSVASVSVFPLQDLMGLKGDARMNTPATTDGNWAWQWNPKDLKPSALEKLSRLTQETQRA